MTSGMIAVAKIDSTTMTATYLNDLGIYGSGVKWVSGETSNLIYILSRDNIDGVSVTKYNIATQAIVWTKLIAVPNGDVQIGRASCRERV